MSCQAQVPQSDQRAPAWRVLAGAVTFAGDDERGDPLDQGVMKQLSFRQGERSSRLQA